MRLIAITQLTSNWNPVFSIYVQRIEVLSLCNFSTSSTNSQKAINKNSSIPLSYQPSEEYFASLTKALFSISVRKGCKKVS
jgi:hypothetical protein